MRAREFDNERIEETDKGQKGRTDYSYTYISAAVGLSSACVSVAGLYARKAARTNKERGRVVENRRRPTRRERRRRRGDNFIDAGRLGRIRHCEIVEVGVAAETISGERSARIMRATKYPTLPAVWETVSPHPVRLV